MIVSGWRTYRAGLQSCVSASHSVGDKHLIPDNTMRKAHKFKLQNQSNTIKIGNMLDDMWEIHIHIMLLSRRYYRIFGKNLSVYRINAHIAKLKKRTKPHWKDLPSQVVQDVVLRYLILRVVVFRIQIDGYHTHKIQEIENGIVLGFDAIVFRALH